VKVSSLLVFDYRLTYNTAQLRMAGIAGLVTAEEYRNRGFASQLMRETIDWMAEEKYDCSFLFGIPNYYWRYGYATVLTHATTTVKLEPVDSEGFLIRELREEDLPAVRLLYNQNNLNRMCSLIRPERWQGFPRGSEWRVKPACFVVESEEGSIEGYAVYDAEAEDLMVSEVETGDPRAQYAVLQGLYEIGAARKVDEFKFLGATNHPFAVFCRRFGAVHQDTVQRYAFGMARLIDIVSFFESTAPELSRRAWLLREGPARTIKFQTDIGSCSLEVSRGVVRVTDSDAPPAAVINCSQLELTRLVFGVVDYQTFSVSSGTSVEGDGELLSILYPTQLNTIPPTLWF